MSTNYYVHTPETKPGDEGIHLGKTAAGWPFLFRAYPDASDRPTEVTWDVKDYASWTRLLDLGTILDETGKEWPKSDVIVMVSQLHRRGRRHHPTRGQFIDGDGNLFTPHEFC